MEETMNWKHLFWIVPFSFLIGAFLGVELEAQSQEDYFDLLMTSLISLASFEHAVNSDCITPEEFMCLAESKFKYEMQLYSELAGMQ